jgi:uroporphyrinogen decarboxylase
MRRPAGRKPDFQRFLRAVTTREPGPVPIGDLFADVETVGNLLHERVVDYAAVAAEPGKLPWRVVADGLRYIDQSIRFCLQTGWDYAYCFSLIPFARVSKLVADNTSTLVQPSKRVWQDDNHGPIGSWQDLERYTWPTDAHGANLMAHIMAKRVPDGMKVMVIPGGVFEWTTWLMGLVPFSFALVDQPDLVDAVIQKVSDTIYAVVEDLLDEPQVGGIFMGDDLGHASGTMISPQVLRTKFFPQTKRMVDLVHQAGKVFCLHTCGNVTAVMDDLCALGIDAKHSFEDKIMPVEEAYRRWSDRIAMIGGVDMNLLASGSEEAVRRRTREILDVCGPGGHYVLGTGNSVANYLPLNNYLAMVDEGRRWNHQRFGA